MGVRSVAGRFEDERPRIVEAYERALTAAGSPLVARGRWSRVRRQAESILRDCAAGLRGEQPELSGADWVSLELMGARRAVDGVPLQESLHAAQLLWGVTRPAVESATAAEPARARAALRTAARRAFRLSAGGRLQAGAVGYGDARLIDALLNAEASLPPPIPAQRGWDVETVSGARAPLGDAHRRIATELGIPETHVRSTLRAALRRAARYDPPAPDPPAPDPPAPASSAELDPPAETEPCADTDTDAADDTSRNRDAADADES